MHWILVADIWMESHAFRISQSLLQLAEEVNNLLLNQPSAIFVLTSGCVYKIAGRRAYIHNMASVN